MATDSGSTYVRGPYGPPAPPKKKVYRPPAPKKKKNPMGPYLQKGGAFDKPDPFARPQFGGWDVPERRGPYGPPAPVGNPMGPYLPQANPFSPGLGGSNPINPYLPASNPMTPYLGGGSPGQRGVYGPPAPAAGVPAPGADGRLRNTTQTASPYANSLFGTTPYGFSQGVNENYYPYSMPALEFGMLNFPQGAGQPEDDGGPDWLGGYGGYGRRGGGGWGGGGYSSSKYPWMTGLYSLSANR